MGAVRNGTIGAGDGTVRHPVTATLASLGEVSGALEIVSSRQGGGWYDFHDPLPLRAWHEAEHRGRAHGHSDVAGALVAYRLAEALVLLIVGPLVSQRRVLVPQVGGLDYRLDTGTASGLSPVGQPGTTGPAISALAVTSATVAVLPDDAGARHPDASVAADIPELLERSANVLVTLFEPVTYAVRACAPYGLRGMWGNLADHIAEVALGYAGPSEDTGAGKHDRLDEPEEAAWQLADALIDRLAASQPLLRGRPQLHRQSEPDGSCSRRVVLKGTCCLVYKAYGRKADGTPLAGRARIEAAACDTCPLRSR